MSPPLPFFVSHEIKSVCLKDGGYIRVKNLRTGSAAETEGSLEIGFVLGYLNDDWVGNGAADYLDVIGRYVGHPPQRLFTPKFTLH